jgi:hypothetical protein
MHVRERQLGFGKIPIRTYYTPTCHGLNDLFADETHKMREGGVYLPASCCAEEPSNSGRLALLPVLSKHMRHLCFLVGVNYESERV